MTRKQRDKAGLKTGHVSATATYSGWFAQQDSMFQREWLGPKRYELYRKGGYSIDRFVDPRGKEYTLEELKKRDAQTFKEVFG